MAPGVYHQCGIKSRAARSSSAATDVASYKPGEEFAHEDQARSRRIARELCHAADLTGNGNFPPLTGDGFMRRWGSKTSSDLFNFISRRMPFDRPGQLAEEDYVVIVAYWLSVHGHAAGNESLTSGSGVVLQP